MKKKSFIAILTVALFAILFTLGACGPMFPKREVTPPEFYEKDGIEVGTDYIKITELYIPYNGLIPQYRINDGEWQDSGEFYNLQPGTTYKVSAYTKENDKYLASDVTDIDITTLRAEQQKVPSASYERQNFTVTLTNVTDEMEVLWEEKSDWTDEKTHTFEKSGKYTVQVRYKENTSYFVGQPQSLEVYANGFKSGNGTEQDPFLISTYDEFMALEEYLDCSSDTYVKIVEDIVFPAEVVTSELFTYSYNSAYTESGNNLYIDGNGCKIISPKINAYIKYLSVNVGLIGKAKEIKNLTVENMEMTMSGLATSIYSATKFSVGLLCGAASYVENCSMTGTLNLNMENYVFANSNVGGLVGKIVRYSNSTESDRLGIVGCVSDVQFNYQAPENHIDRYDFSISYGGIVGGIQSITTDSSAPVEIKECAANLSVSISDLAQAYVGGILGKVVDNKNNDIVSDDIPVSIKNCYSTGSVQYTDINLKTYAETSDQFAYSIGGIAGRMSGTVDSCWSSLDILYKDVIKIGAATACFGGGIVSTEDRSAQSTKTITNCLYTGNMRLDNTTGSAGPMTFFNAIVLNASTDNCYYKNGSEINNTQGSTAVEEATILTATWQRDTLKLDETIWNIVEGSMPTLK